MAAMLKMISRPRSTKAIPTRIASILKLKKIAIIKLKTTMHVSLSHNDHDPLQRKHP